MRQEAAGENKVDYPAPSFLDEGRGLAGGGLGVTLGMGNRNGVTEKKEPVAFLF